MTEHLYDTEEKFREAPEKLRAFIADLQALCVKHSVGIFGFDDGLNVDFSSDGDTYIVDVAVTPTEIEF